ncbi:hypothetical protein AAE478_001757 [Parahypoxylon ruwenzoriense]
MAGPRRARLPVGSAPWISEERSSALQIAQSEVDEFSFSARNDFDWLNEHMADIFSENQINVADIFKTPGKLRGKTPRTIRKFNAGETRVPLSDIFSATPKGAPNPFAMPNINRHNTPKIEIAVDPQSSSPKPTTPASPLRHASPAKPAASKQPVSMVDSGYHGSQSQDAMDVDDVTMDDEATEPFSPQTGAQSDHVAFQISSDQRDSDSPTRHSPNPTLEMNSGDHSTQYFTAHVTTGNSPARNRLPQESTTPAGSPARSPKPILPSTSPMKSSEVEYTSPAPEEHGAEPDVIMETVLEEPSRSPSDGSSPIRPIVRKSSLNFASLPAREPMTHKSIGNRTSRTSHLEQNRTSYYNRHTGGKSLGHSKQDLTDDENDDLDTDEDPFTQKSQPQLQSDTALVHNKTYTQRLQDQISKLGQLQTQASRSSKSIPDTSVTQPATIAAPAPQPLPQARPLSSPKKTTTPGAFPDDEDDWIQPLGSPDNASDIRSPRPGLPKSHSADVMEGVSGKDTIGGSDFAVPKTRQLASQFKSPERAPMSDRPANTFGHHKSASAPMLPLKELANAEGDGLKKIITVSNPPLTAVSEIEPPTTPTKSPTRGLRDSPLKQVKNKLSSILKSSKGLLASSAAISAEGKTSLLSPSTTRLGLHINPSTDTLASPKGKEAQPLYPDLSRHAVDAQTPARPASPIRAEARKTRASTEREKAEEKRKKEEAKEVRRMAEQMDKLEKAREKEREKARVFSKEQERVAAMEKQVAVQKEQEKKVTAPTLGDASNSTRVSPRRIKPQPTTDGKAAALVHSDENQTEDVDMTDVPNPMPPPSAPRSIAPPPSATKGREIKRPIRLAKEPVAKPKQAPTVIRVNTGSQHPQFHPSNSTLSSSLHETLAQPQSKGKPLQTKPSLQSLKSSTSSSGRPKALEAAARRKEQEEREAQRKRDAKAELERKRAAMQEEERRQEQQRKAEAERVKEEERKQAEAKKNAQRQAMLEKAKQTRAPPPAVRSQPNGPPDYSRSEVAAPRPPSRLASTAQRSQDELGRPVNAVLSNASKASTKRPLQQEPNDDNASRQAPARGGNGYQPKDPKRMRMTDEFDDDVEAEKQPNLKGAPVRPSGGYKKDMPTKSLFPAGYTNASLNGNRDLFKATVTNQHNSQLKAAHPLDMAQVSKGPIPFAPNPNAGGSSYKTPARSQGVTAAKSAAKSGTRSSPRFQNGESIELPEINTDDEDDDDDDADDGVRDTIASWADSPNLRKALVRQETQDPMQVFGAPAPLNMEEVFSKSKDRFHKFRARTSSANWSGSDKLTDEDIRKDLAARDQMRRDGGWSYQMVIDYERHPSERVRKE